MDINHIKSHINILTSILICSILILMTKLTDFEWDSLKDKLNQKKQGVSFSLAQLAFLDHDRVILEDLEHSDDEKRFIVLAESPVAL